MGLIARVRAWLEPDLPNVRIETEADRLVEVWGADAYEVARDLSWREQVGLLQTRTPGFWSRVAQEVGHQLGVPERPSHRADLLAG